MAPEPWHSLWCDVSSTTHSASKAGRAETPRATSLFVPLGTFLNTPYCWFYHGKGSSACHSSVKPEGGTMPLLFLLQKHHLGLQSLDSTVAYIELVTLGHIKPSSAAAACIWEALSNFGPSYFMWHNISS